MNATIETTTPPAASLPRLVQLRADLRKLRDEIAEMEAALGFNDTEHLGHYEGTNCEEWRCKLCGKKWLLPDKWPCSECHESTFLLNE